MTTNAPTTTKQKNIKAMLDRPDIQGKIAEVMSANMDPQKITRVALLTINKVPKIAECSIPSLLQCIMDCARMGLEPDGRNAHLIPYGNTCTLILDWKGICKLARESGEVKNLYAELVYEKDDFRIQRGTDPKIDHVPAIRNRGKIIGAYACVIYNNGAFDSEFMTVEEIEGIRARSRSGNNGPWKTDWGEMAKKTAFRRLSKRLPLGRPEQQRSVERVIDRETGFDSGDAPYMDTSAEELTTADAQEATQEAAEPSNAETDTSDKENLLGMIQQAREENEAGYRAACQEYGLDRRKKDHLADLSETELPKFLEAVRNM
jgi:recombination protein RecT